MAVVSLTCANVLGAHGRTEYLPRYTCCFWSHISTLLANSGGASATFFVDLPYRLSMGVRLPHAAPCV